jgi:hypothetical protein
MGGMGRMGIMNYRVPRDGAIQAKCAYRFAGGAGNGGMVSFGKRGTI